MLSINTDFEIIMVKKFGYLETRVTYLEGKCRGQQDIIEKLLDKLEKIETETRSQDKIIVSQVLEDSEDFQPDVQMPKLNESLKGNFERFAKNDKKLNQKLIVQMGLKKCETNPVTLNQETCTSISNTTRRRTKKSQVAKSDKISSKPKRSVKISQDAKTDKNLSKPKESLKKSQNCSFCSKSFPHFSSLSDHMRVHTGERPFKCNICSKSFKNTGDLKTHSRTHTGEKPYSCSFCSKSFAHIQTRDGHIRTHTGERPFSCPHCPKTFTHSSTLSRHKKTHT